MDINNNSSKNNIKQIQLEKLNQELTLELQKIDTNVSQCHNLINTRLIPIISQYSNKCDLIMKDSNWIKNLFEKSGGIELTRGAAVTDNIIHNNSKVTSTKADLEGTNGESVYQQQSNNKAIPNIATHNNTNAINNDNVAKAYTDDSNNNATYQNGQNIQNIVNNDSSTSSLFHTAPISLLSQKNVLKPANNNDNEMVKGQDGNHKYEMEENSKNENIYDNIDGNSNSSIKQRKKRKMSILIQQKYASSSSSVNSPINSFSDLEIDSHGQVHSDIQNNKDDIIDGGTREI